MSENIKVNLSTFDRSVNVINTYNSYRNRKVSEQILVQQYKSNAQLTAMKNQLKEANETNRRILQNQIRELELKEEQKFYKALSYNNNEIIEKLQNVNDPMVLNYLINGFYEKMKSSLVKANDTLEEINDKLFNKQVIEKLELIKQKSDKTNEDFKKNKLYRIDDLLIEFKSKEDEINNVRKIEYQEKTIKDKSETNVLRLFGIIILGFLTFVYGINLFINKIGTTDFNLMLLLFLIVSIPLFFLIKKDRKWRKNFLQYKNTQNQKRQNEFLKKKEIEEQENNKLEERTEMLLNHPAYLTLQEINRNHPTFEETTFNVTNLEANFYKKWGITVENNNDGIVTEKTLKFIKKGEMINASKSYSEDNNVNMNDSRKKINKIAKDFKYKI
ncbi:hypothetical protein [Flavobacterium psychrophilum]|uniref:hypothetical protein n=4 Tax=Flavobacterium psychrophilum TaxID=96345 RepID=UPI0010698B25|nr:hypothetical protein [Flavobacterium psychrophilum]MCB5973072.1 hypothetical protein [Flavobacterium psychrophilum]MCB5979331.1 hypothetical protein [Flavobacterium psychrophilum]MCB5981852.1 hypothetical protein [Flavobacterium psychrophilum]MCB5989883.1 hypothetical protein [Flavobacterium psychrophilum]MCB6002978.1 hypothetical protein [Flavobacterium psychrophilum]